MALQAPPTGRTWFELNLSDVRLGRLTAMGISAKVDDLVVSAVHEAGHLVAGLALRVRVTGATIRPSAAHRSTGHVDFLDEAGRAADLVPFLLAGGVAVGLLLGLDDATGESADRLRARKYAGLAAAEGEPGTPNEILRRATREAHTLIHAHRDAVYQAAGHLLRHVDLPSSRLGQVAGMVVPGGVV